MEFSSCPSDGNCFFAWFSAMSGWVAAAGGLLAALLALPYLSSQSKEAKRQTDFAVGDAQPDFVLARNRRQNAFKLIVTNWNRRTVVIDEITCIEPTHYRVERYWDDKKSIPQKTHPKLTLGGWYDRTKAPNRRNFSLELAFDGGIDTGYARSGRGLAVKVKYRVIGQYHERAETFARAIDIDTEEL